MDVKMFQKAPFGELVPISGSLPGGGTWEHWAFLPNPLPEASPELSGRVDLPPRSRNEPLGAAMRQIGVAEERGSGWDKIAFELEFHQLPPARVDVHDTQTRITIYAPKTLSQMDKPDRILAVYQHACLRWVSNQPTNNTSVRGRFGTSDRNKAQASRIIKEAIEDRAIAPYDPTVGPRSMRYVPFWADPER